MLIEEAAAKEDVAVREVAVEGGEEGVEVALSLELALRWVWGVAVIGE